MTRLYDPLLKTDFSSFIAKTLATINPGAAYLPNWHIDLIAEYLEAVRRRDITRLIVNMPPRSLKSTCVSVAWPAWLLGQNPSNRILAASYAASLSVKHSLDCRLVMDAGWYRDIFPDVRLTKDQNEKRKFMTTARGCRFATSVGGSATGEGGNYLIIDDPLNPAQAMNARSRQKVNGWFDHTFSTRLDDKKKGTIVLVMQRLHQDDLTGYLLDKGGWSQLCLPAVSLGKQLYAFGRVYKEMSEGELMHNAREDQEHIERARKELGGHAFAAQYQQQPVPEDGGMLRLAWFERYSAPPEKAGRRVQSWDTAIKSGRKHDASVCLTFAEYQGKSYLIDAQVMRLEYPDLKRTFMELAERWQPDVILIEDKASGQQLLQDMRRETFLPLIPLRPRTDKVTRFAAVSAMCEAGRVVLPQQAQWLAAFEQELFGFPEASHDDQVDAFTQYLDWLRRGCPNRLRIREI